VPEYLKSLIVILGLAATVFAFINVPACATACTKDDFDRRRNTWVLVVLASFLAHNFWIYAAVSGTLIYLSALREKNKLALFYLLLFAVPPVQSDISGFGIVNNLFALSPVRLLVILVLLPEFLNRNRDRHNDPFGRLLSDKMIAGSMLVNFVLILQVSSFTNALRTGVFYAFIDIFLPYYVASRSVRNLREFRDVLMAFLIAALIIGVVGLFEFQRHWLLYSGLDRVLGLQDSGLSLYLEREGRVRAQASAGHAIVLGYLLAVALGFSLYLRKIMPAGRTWWICLIVLTGGLMATLSRGPWVGAAVIVLVFVLASHSRWHLLGRIGLVSAIVFLPLLASPFGESLISYLPFIGTVNDETVTYRQLLMATGISVILESPFFGAPDFMYSLEDLRQGQGIIDLVNTYLAIGLGSGLVGLSLFCGVFVVAGWGVFRGLRGMSCKTSEEYVLGQTLLATLSGIMVIIFTTSSIAFIPIVYWSMAGICVAYATMVAREKGPVPSMKQSEAVRSELMKASLGVRFGLVASPRLAKHSVVKVRSAKLDVGGFPNDD
jgi:hypothetical protein